MAKAKPRKPKGSRPRGPGAMPGGGGPDMPDMGAMLQQVQQMQADLASAQEELKNETVEATAGGGIVTVTATCEQEITDIRIDPEAVDPEDVEMLQDVIVAGVNEALRLAKATSEERLSAVTGGLDLGSAGQGLGDLLGT